jgi:hypothetical protein
MRTRLDLLLICALAIYRGWRLVARDKVTERWREQAYNRWPPNYKRTLVETKWEPMMRESVPHTRTSALERPKVSIVAASLSCPWCAPTFAAALLTFAVDVSFGLTWPVVWFAALGCLVGLLGSYEGK